jgi:hypothetical protein
MCVTDGHRVRKLKLGGPMTKDVASNEAIDWKVSYST